MQNFKTIENGKNVILVTGAAGFIGAALVLRLLENGEKVIGVDNINDYYEPNLKRSRLENINTKSQSATGEWFFFNKNLEDFFEIQKIFKEFRPKIVFNLAAQAGVRYSIKNPSSYIKSNLVGFSNILELCRNEGILNLIYASSSSVYGGNKKIPFHEDDPVDHPISLYAATKRSNEILAHSYSHLFNLSATGLRFFTVYGPWGRPDMAPMIFIKSILEKKSINVFNNGKMLRDFTYIDDIIECTLRCGYKPATRDEKFNYLNPTPSSSNAPHRVFNIGNNRPILLNNFIELLEKELGILAIKNYLPMQPGDAENTFADCKKIYEWINFKPKVKIEDGIKKFIKWYKYYYDY